MASKDVYRLTFTSSEILSILEAVTTPTVLATCNSDARSLINKLRKKAFEITNGLATPSYVTNGTKGSGISHITADDLGEYNAENTLSTNIATHLFSTSVQSTSSGMPEELTGDMEAQLLALEAAMLAEVASNGAGADNVIPERRKTPRTLDPVITTDDL